MLPPAVLAPVTRCCRPTRSGRSFCRAVAPSGSRPAPFPERPCRVLRLLPSARAAPVVSQPAHAPLYTNAPGNRLSGPALPHLVGPPADPLLRGARVLVTPARLVIDLMTGIRPMRGVASGPDFSWVMMAPVVRFAHQCPAAGTCFLPNLREPCPARAGSRIPLMIGRRGQFPTSCPRISSIASPAPGPRPPRAAGEPGWWDEHHPRTGAPRSAGADHREW